MARVQKVAAIAAMGGAVLFGGVACGGSSTVSAPTTPVAVGSDGPSTLPATTAASDAAAPSGFPGAGSGIETPAEKKYIADLRAKGINDPQADMLLAGHYVCAALAQNAAPAMYQTWVDAIMGRQQRSQADIKKATATVVDSAKSSGMCKK